MDLNKISNFIKQKRKELGITQDELAEKLFVTEKAISRWETGRGTPDISLLLPLSKELNIEVSFDNRLINSFESVIELKNYLKEKLFNLVDQKKIELQEENITRRLSNILLSTFDRNWPSQLTAMDHLRHGVFLRQYANERPLTIYKKESYELFNDMYLNIAKQSLVSFLKTQSTKHIIDEQEKLIIQVE